jgi:hypothetical protein
MLRAGTEAGLHVELASQGLVFVNRGFLRSAAPFSSDLTLAVEIGMGLALLAGMLLARRRRYLRPAGGGHEHRAETPSIHPVQALDADRTCAAVGGCASRSGNVRPVVRGALVQMNAQGSDWPFFAGPAGARCPGREHSKLSSRQAGVTPSIRNSRRKPVLLSWGRSNTKFITGFGDSKQRPKRFFDDR